MIAFSRLEISFIENGFINNFRIIQRGPFKGWAMVPSNNQKHDASVFTVFDFNKGFEFEKDVFSFDIQIQDEKAEFYLLFKVLISSCKDLLAVRKPDKTDL